MLEVLNTNKNPQMGIFFNMKWKLGVNEVHVGYDSSQKVPRRPSHCLFLKAARSGIIEAQPLQSSDLHQSSMLRGSLAALALRCSFGWE